MSSLVDIFTVAKNIVTAINGWSQTLVQVNGATSATEISSQAVVKSGQGRIARVSVIEPGSSMGFIRDASSVSSTGARVFTIPMSVGVHDVNMPVSNGIVVSPGSGQIVSISYS